LVRGDVAVGLESHGRRKLFCTQFLPKVARRGLRGVNWAGNSVIDAKPGIGSTKRARRKAGGAFFERGRYVGTPSFDVLLMRARHRL
jgi:hypothetical protein